jgi:hypothetical protein
MIIQDRMKKTRLKKRRVLEDIPKTTGEHEGTIKYFIRLCFWFMDHNMGKAILFAVFLLIAVLLYTGKWAFDAGVFKYSKTERKIPNVKKVLK